MKSISGKAPRFLHPAWEKAAGNVDAAIAGAGPGGPVLGLLILLARQAWDTSFTKQQRKKLQPPWLQPAPEHMPVCKHSGQQDRSRFDNTFGLNRQCKHVPGYTMEAPESDAPPGSTGTVSAAVSETSRHLVLVPMYTQPMATGIFFDITNFIPLPTV